MESWMISLIIVAAIIALVAVAVLAGALVCAHMLLGRRKIDERFSTDEHLAKYGADREWWNTVADNTVLQRITAYDGARLCAKLVRHETPSVKVAVCCHGYGATPDTVQPQAKIFYDLGFDVLVPDMRGHGESEGKVGMAWIDRFDISRWIDKIVKDYGESVSVVLFGVSMGGSTAVAVAGMTPPEQLRCVIDDCGFSSQLDEYEHNFSAPIMFLIKMGVKLVHGYPVAEANIAGFAKSVTIPVLFIHGNADKFVPIEQGKKLYEACASENKTFCEIEGAEHARAYAADNEKYTNALTEFVRKYIPSED